ncbi:MAG: alpha/beta fold hydrolase [Bacteriovoracia bacterium]
MRRHKLKIGVAIVVVASLAIGYAWFGRGFAIEREGLRRQFELWRAGVQEIQLGSLHAYERNHCAKKTATASPVCRCVVLIHGMADEGLTWRRLLVAEGATWKIPVRLVALDLPAAGKSPPPVQPEDFRVRRLAQTVSASLAKLEGCDERVIVGNSLGGWVASWLALDHPALASRLLLLSPAGIRAFSATRDPNDPVAKLFREPTVEGLKEFQARAYYKPRPLPDEVWKLAVERMKSAPTAGGLAAQTPEDYLDANLSQLRVPTMILWGEADRIIPLEQGRIFKDLVPGAVFQSIAECGHLPQKECPQVVIQALHQLAALGLM